MTRLRDVEIPPRSPGRGLPALIALIALVVGVGLLGYQVRGCRKAKDPAPTTSVIEVKAAPDVILAMRDLSRLETASYQMEKVIELTDSQQHVWGLVEAKDALLLVAVGEVTAGVDLSKLDGNAVKVDWKQRSVKVTLPRPEIFHAHLDNAKTHVYARTTDSFAKRNEALESKARLLAEQSMQKAATDAGILERARAQAERTVRATLGALGFTAIEVDFQPPGAVTKPP